MVRCDLTQRLRGANLCQYSGIRHSMNHNWKRTYMKTKRTNRKTHSQGQKKKHDVKSLTRLKARVD